MCVKRSPDLRLCPPPGSLTAFVIHTDVAHTGSLKFSDPLLQGIQSAIHWGQRCNILSVPTDCPQRDERKVPPTQTHQSTHRALNLG
jgi:hypothetical protein